jgi:hypothetical protein
MESTSRRDEPKGSVAMDDGFTWGEKEEEEEDARVRADRLD